LRLETANAVRVEHHSLGSYQFAFDTEAVVLFTENETNAPVLGYLQSDVFR